ncbi:MAG: hypothetical protein KDC53_25595, partial [Saprospiraceae bacterium]|nr:hypothetical protein [Saprospiraceae bacterium]
MMNEIRTGLVLIALLILVRLEAQEIAETPKGEGAIFMLCHPNDETLQVRWAPDSWKIYQQAIKQGFTLTKTSIRVTDTLVVTYDLKIPAKTIFSTHADAENDYAAAYHLLYEEVENTAGILGEYSAFEVGASRYGMLLFLADLNFSLAEYLQLGWTDEDYDPGYTNIYTIRINGSSF